MKRILVFGMTENLGGIESFIINYYRNIDRDEIQFDFLCNTLNKVAYEEELQYLGANIYHIAPRRENRLYFKKELEKIFLQHAKEWDAIWVNTCNLVNIDYLIFAKKYGIKQRIIHSHNSENMEDPIRGLLHLINKKRIKIYATDFWACSDSAADWFYNDDVRDRVVVIHNAISADKMRFDAEKRKQIREKHGFGDKYVIGNVGRLHFQKNQAFLLEIFREYHAHNTDSLLVLIGQGEDERKLKEKVKKEGLEKEVYFMGTQKDIQGWLSSFDLFIFPSLFEGLGIAALEAQANGVPVMASDKVIPREVKINDNFIFYSLDKPAKKWAEQIHKMRETYSRGDFNEIKRRFLLNGYEISTEASVLTQRLI